MNFSDAMQRLKAKVILCDLDDTILHTNRIFTRQIELFCSTVHAAIPSIPRFEIEAHVHRLSKELYASESIKKSNWSKIAAELVAIYGRSSEEVIENALGFMLNVYETVPDLRTGALEFLREVKESQIPLAIITHGTEAWTDLKLSSHKLHFYIEQLHIVPESEHKTERHWAQAIKALNVAPSEVIAIGDSILTDMWPARKCGVNMLIWVDKPDGWNLYRQGTLPVGAHAIKELTEVIPLICRLPWN